MTDTRFTEPDIETRIDDQDEKTDIDDAYIADGDVQIVDIDGYTMRHLAYISIFVLRVYMKFVQEAYPSRLRAIHIINCPSFLDRMMAMMKPFIRDEVYQMVTYKANQLLLSQYLFTVFCLICRLTIIPRAWTVSINWCLGICCP